MLMCCLLAHAIATGQARAEAAATTPTSTPWLSVRGNRIVTPDGRRWVGRGANLQDSRSCWACQQQNVGEVARRAGVLIDEWGANFIRLTMETHDAFANVTADPAYLQEIVDLVRAVGQRPNVYVLVALWHDPSLDPKDGFPSPAGHAIWALLADVLADMPQVMFGPCNEPTGHDGSRDAEVHQRMSDTVEVIRRAERAHGDKRHLIAVQGTYDYGRFTDYYLQHPITAGGGENIVYETHIYNRAEDFEALLAPAARLPLIIGEFGPRPHIDMTMDDCEALIAQAELKGLSWMGWTFHQQCPPNLIQALGKQRCSIGMPIVPTKPWGEMLRRHLQRHRL